MPKRYFCDFCDKSFQDTPLSRKRHLQGAGHQRNRRMHYDSFEPTARPRPPAADRSQAAVLYSELSGEGILQQWLALHPEVVERQKEEERKTQERERRTNSRREGTVGALERGYLKSAQFQVMPEIHPPPSQPVVQPLPPELEPFRAVLPPSLLPPCARMAFPCSVGSMSPEWG